MRFLRQPSVSATEIAFVHANDVWVVGREGGQARRLTTSEGAETEPAFSPDGRWIAFTGDYGGNQDVYLVEAEGGQPRRLTTSGDRSRGVHARAAGSGPIREARRPGVTGQPMQPVVGAGRGRR